MFTPIPPTDGSDYDSVSLSNKQTTNERIQGLIDGALARSGRMKKVRREHPELMQGTFVGEDIEEKTMFLVSCTNHNTNCNKRLFYSNPRKLFIVIHEFGEAENDFTDLGTESLEEAVKRYNEIEV
ncbi:hypothetical protein [Vibrio mediterranei]|uniref:hypothetical protein n=1 Tax=Vibrio mediterranei TaxID=689 RepID=UPI004067CC6B